MQHSCEVNQHYYHHMRDKERERWQARCHQMTGDLANIIEEFCSKPVPKTTWLTSGLLNSKQLPVAKPIFFQNCGGDYCCCISQNHIFIFFEFYFKSLLSSLCLWLPMNYTGKLKKKKKIFPPWKKSSWCRWETD